MNTGWLFCPWTARRPPVSALDAAFHGFCQREQGKDDVSREGILEKWIGKYTELSLEFSRDINCHHNYASFENHYGKDVWVHRKGAVSAQNGELAVIPGAMGSYSYVVMGKGNQVELLLFIHGAGRQYSRKGAMAAFSCEEVILDLQKQGVILGKRERPTWRRRAGLPIRTSRRL